MGVLIRGKKVRGGKNTMGDAGKEKIALTEVEKTLYERVVIPKC